MPGCHLASKRERRGTRGTKGGRFDVNVPRGMKLTMTMTMEKQPVEDVYFILENFPLSFLFSGVYPA